MRSAILFLALICAVTFAAFGQQSTSKESRKSVLRPIEQNGRWGYIDNTGKIVIKPQFKWAVEFSEGLAGFEGENGKHGYIDETGKIVIEPIFKNWTNFSEGLAAVSIDFEWGYIDHTGNWVIPKQFYVARPFSNGWAIVGTSTNGKVTFPPGPRKDVFIDKTGKVVSSEEDSVLNGKFDDGSGTVQFVSMHSLRNVIIDKTGKVLLKADKLQTEGFPDGLAAVKLNGNWGFADKNGNIVIAPQYEEVGPFSEGLAAVFNGKKIGFIDHSGKVAIPLTYEYCGVPQLNSFSEGLDPVCLDDGWGYVNKTGQLVINLHSNYAEQFIGGLANVGIKRGDHIESGYINRQGKLVWQMTESKNQTLEKPPNQGKKEAKDIESLTPLTPEEKSLDPRDIIANQPDFGANLEWFYNEGFGGLGGTEHIAHKGDKYREESQYWVFVGEIGKNAIRLNSANKTYTVSDRPKFEPVVGPNAFDPRLLARNSDFSFTSLGTLQQGGHKYLKIEGSAKDGNLKVTMYVALEMKNIIVNAQLANSTRSIGQRIGNISFDVPDSLVEVPSDYKKN